MLLQITRIIQSPPKQFYREVRDRDALLDPGPGNRLPDSLTSAEGDRRTNASRSNLARRRYREGFVPWHSQPQRGRPTNPARRQNNAADSRGISSRGNDPGPT